MDYLPRGSSIRDRLLAYSIPEPNSGCWLWLGAYKDHDRGVLSVDGKAIVASRLSYDEFVEEIPEGMHVLHKCDNPTCINPNHLFLGTHIDNMLDRNVKERTANRKLTAADAYAIRKLRETMTLMEIAKLYGVHFSTIARISTYQTWKHVK